MINQLINIGAKAASLNNKMFLRLLIELYSKGGISFEYIKEDEDGAYLKWKYDNDDMNNIFISYK